MIFTMNHKSGEINKTDILKKLTVFLFWILLWEALNLLINNDILFVGPFDVAKRFFLNMGREGYLLSIATSLGTMLLGLVLGVIFGCTFGALSHRFSLFDEIFSPFVATLKSIPVASFVVLLLIWAGPTMLSCYICLLIVFPTIYVSVKGALESTDCRMLDMAKVYGMKTGGKITYIYKSSLAPFLDSGLKIAVGMGIKSAVAAEIIGLPSHTLGERLYLSKVSLETADLFAWTLTIIIIGFLLEKAVLFAWRKYAAYYPVPRVRYTKRPEHSDEGVFLFSKVSKSYGDEKVVNNKSFSFEFGKNYCLMGPSGCGKTTLLSLMMGTLKTDDGFLKGDMISGNATTGDIVFSAVFQENRLMEDANGVVNVMAATGVSEKDAREGLGRLLGEEYIYKPVRDLSGGQKRRICIVRAVMAASDIIVLDEPFTGLDGEAVENAVNYILENKHGRTIVMSTHLEAEARMMDAKVIKL